MFLKIKLNNSDQLLVGCINRHQTQEEGKEKFLTMMSKLPYDKYTHILLTGDFNFRNIDWAVWESTSSNPQELDNRFIEIVRDSYLYQHITTPTRCRADDTPSCLDLVFTNEEGMISDAEISSPLGKGDHACIQFWFNCYVNYKKVQFQKFLYDKGNYEEIRKELNINWEEEMKTRITVNEKWNYLTKKIHTATNKHIPKCKSTPSKKLKYNTPLDKKSLSKIKKKHKAWKKYMASRESDHYKEYCKYRNQVRNLTKKARKEQEKGVAKDAKTNPKKFWKFVNGKTKTRPGIPNLQKNNNDDDDLTSNDHEKAEVLLNFFSSVFTQEPDGDIPDLEHKPHVDHTLEEIEIDEDLVKKKLNALNPSKSPGPDGIHPRVLKELTNTIAKPLTLLFKATQEQHTIPEVWKSATVSAIYKKGKKKDPSNYRPVSLTCISCKVIESIYRDNIMKHMKNNNLFSNSQFGFIGGRSTVLQLLNVIDHWTEILDEGGIIDTIYLDFMKAFDKVPHKRLLAKLEYYGIGAPIISWIDSFLTGRKQRVVVNGYSSGWAEVTSGIPQGSVLGPLLFVIYINDLPSNIISDIYLFADDTKLYSKIDSLEDASQLQEDLRRLEQWSEKWLLRFHPDKCKVLDIGIRDRVSYEYFIGNTKLNHTTEEKDLGVFIDNKLNFNSHISQKIDKANNTLGAIRRSFSYLDKTILLRLYTALVRPHIEYANPVWSPRLRKDIDAIENVQRRATKMVPEIRDLPYSDRLKALNLPTLAYRRARGDMIETYKILNNKYDQTVSNFLPLHQNVHPDSNTRGHSLKLLKRRSNKEIRKNSFSFRIVDAWNSLPNKVVTAPSTKSFERRLDKCWGEQDLKYDYKSCLKKLRLNLTHTGTGTVYSDDSFDGDLAIEVV